MEGFESLIGVDKLPGESILIGWAVSDFFTIWRHKLAECEKPLVTHDS